MTYHMQRFETTLRQLLPLDFPEDVAVYVVSKWDLDYSPMVDKQRCSAFVHPSLDLYLRSALEKSGRWQGRGFCTIVYEREFYAHDLGQHHDTVLMNIVVHEAAHWLTYREPVDDPAADSQTAARYQLDVVLDNLAPIDPVRSSGEGHGPEFIRSALHLMTRVGRAGLLTSHELINIHRGKWSKPEEYLAALQGEPEKRINEPLRTVLADEPPKLFTAMAEYDRKRAAA